MKSKSKSKLHLKNRRRPWAAVRRCRLHKWSRLYKASLKNNTKQCSNKSSKNKKKKAMSRRETLMIWCENAGLNSNQKKRNLKKRSTRFKHKFQHRRLQHRKLHHNKSRHRKCWLPFKTVSSRSLIHCLSRNWKNRKWRATSQQGISTTSWGRGEASTSPQKIN